MKDFIEVTLCGGNTKTLLQTKLITRVDEPGDSEYQHTYVSIIYNDETINIQETYEQIKKQLK